MRGEFYPFFDVPLLFGHRGCSASAPENTMASFNLCRQHGVGGIELDVQRCRSGELVIMHDFGLKRTTGADGLVEQTDWDTLRELDAGESFSEQFRGERIPQLDELFEQFGTTMKYDIELKSAGYLDSRLAEDVWETIERHSLADNCMISSFNPLQVRMFRKACEDTIPTAVIYKDTPKIPRILRKGWGRHIARCSALKPYFTQMDESIAGKERIKRSYPLIAWTVDDAQTAEELLSRGVRGIISNRPEDLLHLFPRR